MRIGLIEVLSIPISAGSGTKIRLRRWGNKGIAGKRRSSWSNLRLDSTAAL
jgi:hypothetical protein